MAHLDPQYYGRGLEFHSHHILRGPSLPGRDWGGRVDAWEEEMMKVYCKYYPKAICLRDDTSNCVRCPYYETWRRENAK